MRSPVEWRKGTAPFGSQRQRTLPRVRRRSAATDEFAPPEFLQNATQIAAVESQVVGELTRGDAGPVRELVEYADLGQRERARQQAFVQDADAARLEPVEMPDGGDPFRLVDLIKDAPSRSHIGGTRICQRYLAGRAD